MKQFLKHFLVVLALLGTGVLVAIIPVFQAVAAPPLQTAQEGQALFQQKCSACHTIGRGRLVGPDLEGVTGRRDLTWIQNFILGPDKVIASGDPIAAQLLKENNNVAMPNLALKETEVQALIAYLENPAAAGLGAVQPAAALPLGGALAGQKLFTGETRLAGGGANCIACHTVSGAGALGGGSLGPDLTNVVTRLSEPGLTSALGNIVFPTMQGPFLNRPLTPQEQADLVAYLKSVDQQVPTAASRLTGIIFSIGIGGALLLFAGMVVFWPKQRESLSARLRRTGKGNLNPTKRESGRVIP